MYRIALSREPTADGAGQQRGVPEETTSAPAAVEKAALSALTDLAHVTLNLNEFAYIQ